MAFPRQDTLFKDYVKTFLKCKQEASGYPGHVKTAEEKEKYIEEYFKKGGHPVRPRQNLRQQGGEKLQQTSSEFTVGQI